MQLLSLAERSNVISTMDYPANDATSMQACNATTQVAITTTQVAITTLVA